MNEKRKDVSNAVMSEDVAETLLNNLNIRYTQDPAFTALRKEGIEFVPGDGPLNPGIMIVGESPGHMENEKGVPFVGKSGKYLNDFLREAKIKPKDVYMTNLVKYWPQNPEHAYKTRPFTDIELSTSKRYLEAEIGIVKPTVVGLCGFSVIEQFIPDFETIYAVNGDLIDNMYVPLYHPTVVLNNPTKKSEMRFGYKMLKAYSERLKGK